MISLAHPSLTKAQRRYLASFAQDLEPAEKAMPEADFVGRLAGHNFDGECQLGEFRVALALQGKGLLSRVERHGAGFRCLSVDFTAEGALALYRVVRREAANKAVDF